MALSETARLIASLELQDKFSKPAAGIEGSAKKLDKTFSNLGKNLGSGLSSATRNLERIGLIAGGLAVGGLVASVNAASDLNESVNKANVVFGAFADKVHSFGQTAASSLGLSRQQAEESASSFGNLFKVVGLTDDASADMSIKLVTLAGDLASFNNIDPAEALDKLRSGLIGEAEPLRSVGVLLTEAAVQEEAYSSGLAKRGTKLTEAQKVQARYNLILKQTTTAQGDFARTSDGLANQQRILKAQLTDTAAVIGTALLPTVNKLLLQFTTLLKEHQPDIQKFADSLPGIASRVEAVIGGLPWETIGGAFKLMGSGAKLALEAFEGAPPWLQTAILTGWGLNKLTGGSLGKIAIDIGKGFFQRGSTPANPLFVSQVGGIPGGGGGAPVAGAPGVSVLGTVAAVAAGVAVGTVIAAPAFEASVAPARKFEETQFNALTDRLSSSNTSLKDIDSAIATIESQERSIGSNSIDLLAAGASQLTGLVTGQKGVLQTLEDQKAQLIAQRAELAENLGKAAVYANETSTGIARLAEIQAPAKEAAERNAAAVLDSLRGQAGSLIRLEEKKFDPTVNVNVAATANISVSNVSRTLTSFHIAGTTTVGGFTESAF